MFIFDAPEVSFGYTHHIMPHIKNHQNLIYDSPGGLLAAPEKRPKQILAITTNMTWFSSTAEITNAINSFINFIVMLTSN